MVGRHNDERRRLGREVGIKRLDFFLKVSNANKISCISKKIDWFEVYPKELITDLIISDLVNP